MTTRSPKVEPYFIERDQAGCSKCGDGRSWAVICPDGSQLSQSWVDEDDAAYIAEILNDAFLWGQSSKRKKATKTK